MRPKQHMMTNEGDLFGARPDQIINMRHEQVQLVGRIDWACIDGQIMPLYSDKGRPGIETGFAIGLLLLKHIYGLSDEGACERGCMTRIFSTSPAKFFQLSFLHERSDLSHWRKRLGDKLELLLGERCERRAADERPGVRLRQSYLRIAKRAAMMAGRYAHAK